MRIGIMGAMDEEVALILSDMRNPFEEKIGVRSYYSGLLYSKDVVLTISGWGKVESASTATTLLIHYGVEAIILSGVAGSASPEINVGDIVVAKELVNHDLDASPIFPKYQVPLLGVSRFETDPHLRNSAILAAERFVSRGITDHIDIDALAELQITKPTVHHGLVASGDQFISNPDVLARLHDTFPDLKCVEMEGAAVAQVCYEHNIPLVVIRSISDKADRIAKEKFPLFISKAASHYSRGILQNLLILL